MKKITNVIKLLEGIELGGGDVNSFSLSKGLREARLGDKGFEPDCGWVQQGSRWNFFTDNLWCT